MKVKVVSEYVFRQKSNSTRKIESDKELQKRLMRCLNVGVNSDVSGTRVVLSAYFHVLMRISIKLSFNPHVLVKQYL